MWKKKKYKNQKTKIYLLEFRARKSDLFHERISLLLSPISFLFAIVARKLSAKFNI